MGFTAVARVTQDRWITYAVKDDIERQAIRLKGDQAIFGNRAVFGVAAHPCASEGEYFVASLEARHGATHRFEAENWRWM